VRLYIRAIRDLACLAVSPFVHRSKGLSKTTQNPDLDRVNGSRGHKNAFSVVIRRAIMAQGTVKFFNAQKGYGFIVQDGGGPDVFVHISAVEQAGLNTLVEGQKVTFDVQADRRSGKSAAANLQAA